MSRFLSSRTGALLTLGITVLVIGFSALPRQKGPALSPLASVTPPAAVCGNNRCELGEKATVRLGMPKSGGREQYGNLVYADFGRAIASMGDTDNDGTLEILVGARRYVNPMNGGGNINDWGTVWKVHLNSNGTMKSVVGMGGGMVEGEELVSSQFGSDTFWGGDSKMAYANVIASLGTINQQPIFAVQSFNGMIGAGFPGVGQPAIELVGAGNTTFIPTITASDLANIGDIDGNGVPDLAIGQPTFGNNDGQVTIAFIKQDFTSGGQAASSLATIPADATSYYFGEKIALLGDIDGDGKTEIAVTDMERSTGKARIWVISLNGDGTAASRAPAIVPGVSFSLNGEPDFGGMQGVQGGISSMTGIGDWDGDGVPDLAIGGPTGVWILSLNSNKTVKSARIIKLKEGASDLGMFSAGFSYTLPPIMSLSALPDMDGDGKKELLIGEPGSGGCGGSNGVVDIFFSRSLTSCPKDCNWCLGLAGSPAGSPSSPSQINMPSTYSPAPTCNNGSCDIKDLSPIPVPGGTVPISVSSPLTEPILSMGSVSIADLGDFYGNGKPTIAMGGPMATYSSYNPHQNEVHIVALNPNGTISSVQRLFEGTGGLVTGDPLGKYIGAAVAAVGDIDGDGMQDLAASALDRVNSPPNGNALWILFLKRDGTVKSFKKIAAGVSGFNDTIAGSYFGSALAPIGDFDGDGVPDLAVGDIGNEHTYPNDYGPVEGLVHLLLLNRDGTVKSTVVLHGKAFTGPGVASAYFGSQIGSLGDPYQDGRLYLAVSGKDNNWSIFLNRDGTVNAWKTFTPTVYSNDYTFGGIANAGDQNGDGRPELAVAVIPKTRDSAQQGISVVYNVVAATAEVQPVGTRQIRLDAQVYNNSTPMGVWNSIATISDLDGDGKREILTNDGSIGYCGNYVYSNYVYRSGLVWLYLSGAQGGACTDDCNSVNFCSASFGAGSSSSRAASSAASSIASSVVSSALSSSRSSSVMSSSSASSSVHSSVASSAASSAVSSSRSSSISFSVGASSALSFASSSLAQSSTLSSAASSVVSSAAASSSPSVASSAPSSAITSSEAMQSSSAFSAYSSIPIQTSSTAYSTPARCGDGNLNPGEGCETGHPCPNGGFCMVNCQCQARSSASASNAYSSTPTIALCGNALLEGSEECETGSPCLNGGFCTVSCQCEDRGSSSVPSFAFTSSVPHAPLCGDALLEGTEECEISASCPDPAQDCDLAQCRCVEAVAGTICGDGRVDTGEECELNTSCPFSWACDEQQCRCNVVPICGNSLREENEECDDGNTLSNDGCSSFCQRETPSLIAASPLCGNGLTESPEECDDGNLLDSDGCSSFCQREYPSATSLLNDRGAAPSPDFTPTLIPETPSLRPSAVSSASSRPAIAPILRPVAHFSSSQQILVQQPLEPQPVTIPFPTQQTTSLSPSLSQYAPIQSPSPWQLSYAPYASIIPYASSAGPAGKTGPASVAIMAAGAAAGFAWVRRKRRE